MTFRHNGDGIKQQLAIKECVFSGKDPHFTDDHARVLPLHIATLIHSVTITRRLFYWNANLDRAEIIYLETPQDRAQQRGRGIVFELGFHYRGMK